MPVATQQSLYLEPLAGPAMPAVRLESGDGPATLGRSASCRVVLADPDGTVSRNHAELRPAGGVWLLLDLRSKHGTFVNGHRVRESEATPLRDGDRVRIGPWTFHVGQRVPGRETRVAATSDDRPSLGGALRRVEASAGHADAAARLGVLMRCASQLPTASSEMEAARMIVDGLLAGSGYPRAAVVRPVGSGEAVEVLAAGCLPRLVSDEAFSRSLLDAAMRGETSSLTSEASTDSKSAVARGLTRAMSAPVMLDDEADAALYLESRAGEPAPLHSEDAAASAFVQAMAQLLALALSGLHRQRLVVDRQRQNAELNNAHAVQRIIMAPARGELRLAGGSLCYAMRSVPGRFVAGDLFDCFTTPDSGGDEVACLLLGDVVGKGIAAGIVMANLQAHLAMSLRLHTDPGRAARDATSLVATYGQRLTEGGEHGSLFLSAWLGILDARRSTLRFTDAGHGYAILHEPGKAPVVVRGTGGPPLGVDGGYAYGTDELPITEGTRVLVFSDGLTEQRSLKGEQFGVARTVECLSATTSADDAVEHILTKLRAFTGTDDGQTFGDDVTIACARVGASVGTGNAGDRT